MCVCMSSEDLWAVSEIPIYEMGAGGDLAACPVLLPRLDVRLNRS